MRSVQECDETNYYFKACTNYWWYTTIPRRAIFLLPRMLRDCSRFQWLNFSCQLSDLKYILKVFILSVLIQVMNNRQLGRRRKPTKPIGWFRANTKFPRPRQFRYSNFPAFFKWNKKFENEIQEHYIVPKGPSLLYVTSICMMTHHCWQNVQR